MEKIKEVAKFTCPNCGKEMEVYSREDHSFWPEGILELIMSCECGFKSTDVLPLRSYPPSRLSIKVESPEDLNIRLVKSSRAIVRIPELGVEINPGTASEGYISNIEGVLDRIENILIDMVKWGKPNADSMLKKIQDLRENLKQPFTLIIEDPSGCSLIVSDRTKKADLLK